MALNIDVIEITQPASVLNRIQTYNLAAGFDPKAIIIYGTPQTSDGATVHWAYGIGYATYRGGVVQQAYCAMRSLDAAGSADLASSQGFDACFRIMTQSAGAGTIDGEITLNSMTNSGTPNVKLDWSNFHTTAGIKLFMIVLGGSDITDAVVGQDAFGAGVTSYEIDNAHGFPVGFGQPDFVFMCSTRDAPGSSATTPQWTSGFGKKGEDGRSFSMVQTDGNTASIVAASQRTDRIFRKIAPAGGSVESSAKLAAPALWPTDGFEITFDAATAFAVEFYYLALKGTFQSVTGHGDSPTAGGLPVNQDLACGFAPKLGYVEGWNLISNGAVNTTSSDLLGFGIGATDGTTQGFAGFTEDDAATTMQSNMMRSATKIIQNWTPVTPTLDAEADGSFNGNNFRLSWTSLDTVGRQYQWFALGDAASSGTGHTQNPSDSVTMADAVVFELVKGVADSVAMSDAQTRAFEKAMADTVGLADNTATAKAIPMAPADSVTMSDNQTLEKAIPVSPADSVTMSDSQVYDRGKQVDDTLAVADNASTAKDVPLAPADSVTMSDNTATELGKTVEVNDSVTMSDVFVLDRGLGVADSVGLADAVVYDRSVLLQDSVSLSDLAVFAREVLFGDTLGLGDATQALISKTVNVDDSVSVSDNFQRVLEYARTVNDAVTPSDNVVFVKNIPLSPADSVTMSDNAVVGKELARFFDDTVGLADLAVFTVDKVLNVNDTLPLTDETSFARVVAVEDALSLSDALERSYGLSAADVLALSDLADPVLDVAGGIDYELFPADSITVSDALSFIRGVLFTETLPVSDAHVRFLNGVPLSDGSTAVLRQGIIYIGRF